MRIKKETKKTIHLVKRLYKHTGPYRFRFVEAMLCMVIVAVTTAFLMYLVKPVFDRIFEQKNVTMIPLIMVLIVIAVGVKGIFSYIQSYLMAFIGQKVIMDLRNKLYNHLQQLSLDYFTRHRSGQIVSRITNDVMLLQTAIVTVPENVIREGLTVILLIGVLFYLQWFWTLVALAIFPLVGLILVRFGRKLRSISGETQSRIADIYSFLNEKIMGIKLIKSFCMEVKETKKFESENKKLFNVIMRAMRLISLQSPVMEFIVTLGIVMILALGGYSVINGHVTIGTFFAFSAAASSLYRSLKSFAGVNKEVQQALAASERIFYVLDSRSFIIEYSDAKDIEPVREKIVFKDVSFAYGRRDKVLKNINLEIQRGEVIALVGPSGSGKSTVANLIARFYDPTEGDITIDGLNIKEASFKSLRGQMGIVTQETMLFNDSIRNNIAYGEINVSDEQIVSAMRTADIYDFVMSLPDKYRTVVGERGMDLSSGERQRIAIARAVLKNPAILILDEATSSLDSESEIQVQKALDNLIKHRTALIIAHRLSTIKNADRIVVMDKGCIIEEGKHRELMEKGGLYKRLYELQFNTGRTE